MHTYDDDRWAFEKWIVNVENIVVHIYRPDRSTGINITKKHTKKKRRNEREKEEENPKRRSSGCSLRTRIQYPVVVTHS